MKKRFIPILGFLLLLIMSIGHLAEAADDAGFSQPFPDSHLPYWYAPTRFGTTGLYNLLGTDTVGPKGFSLGVYADFSQYVLPLDPRTPNLTDIRFVGTFGITERLEIGGAIPYVNLSTDSEFDLPEFDESGIGDINLTVKVRLVDDVAGRPGIGAFGIISFPSGDEEKGLGSGSTDFTVGGIITKRAGALNLYGNVGYFFSGESDTVTANCFFTQDVLDLIGQFCNPDVYEDAFVYGGGFEVDLARNSASRLALFGEATFYNETRGDDDEKESPIDDVDDQGQGVLGLRFGTSNGLSLTGGWRARITGEEAVPKAPHYGFFGGVAYTFAAKPAPPTPIPTPTPEPTPIPPRPTPTPITNKCPEITVMVANPDKVTGGASVQIRVEASDPDNGPSPLTYEWSATGGSIEGSGPEATWTAPSCQELGAPSRTFEITVKVNDGECPVTKTVTVEVSCEQVLEGAVNFGPGSSRLDNIAKAILDNIATSLQQYPDQAIIIQGHSDNRGSEEANRRISLKRAEAVRDYLVKRHGIDPGRIKVEAYGSERPVASNDTEEGRRQNRRVEIYRSTFK
jgi:outer membrane protein OmpA-like peptidoglycan-associated protein